jgi:hypothetical protein
MDVVLVLLDPGLDGIAGLPSINLTALARHTLHTRIFESQVLACSLLITPMMEAVRIFET